MPVLTVYRGDDPDTAAGLARGIQSTGVRAIAAHWFGQNFVYRFDDMNEADIDSWMDQEWTRLSNPNEKNGPAEVQLDEASAPTKGTEMNTTMIAQPTNIETVGTAK